MHWLDPDYLPETRGTVRLFLINPHGEIDGLILDDNPEVHLPPHLSSKVARAVSIGQKVAVRGVRPRNADMIAAVALEANGKRIVDNGPGEKKERGKKAKRDGKDTFAGGKVLRLLHAPKGEVRGALLEGDLAVRFPKHAAEKLRSLLKVGGKVATKGLLIETKHGQMLDAHAVGKSPTTLKAVPKPKPKPHSKPA